MARRIIINIKSDDITDEEAMSFVAAVIRKGRISNGSKQYPYCVSWPFSKVDVYSSLTKTGNDSFELVKQEGNDEKV